jgi:hypothetical protein
MAATDPDTASQTASPTTPQTTARNSTAAAELVAILESDTETLTGAVAAGTVTLDQLDRFVRAVDRGETDGCRGVDAVIRIVSSLLGDDTPCWEEMEAAAPAVGR